MSAPNARPRPRVPPFQVSIETPEDRAEWTLRLNCNEEQLREAIARVGSGRMAIQQHLKDNRTPSYWGNPANDEV
jgi:hypothetical protein